MRSLAFPAALVLLATACGRPPAPASTPASVSAPSQAAGGQPAGVPTVAATPALARPPVATPSMALGATFGPAGIRPTETRNPPPAPPAPTPSTAPLAPQLCADVETYADARYVDTDRGPFDLRYLKGTLAERDLDTIYADRLAAYDRIADFLGLDDPPKITVVLSPNRLAAFAHGYSVGQAFPAKDEVDVLYLQGNNSYERHHFGHELTHVLATAVDGRMYHVPFLDEGLAVYLDGSGRDLHQAYVDDLDAGAEDPTYETGFEDADVYGRNYGREGSFVSLFVHRYGRAKLLELWRAAAVTWHGWTMVDTLGDPITDGPSLAAAIDHLLRTVVGEGLGAFRAAWRATLDPYLAAAPTPVPIGDRVAITSIVDDADLAVNTGDPDAYRATMDGFYCKALDDAARMRIADGKTDTAAKVSTKIVGIYSTGVHNYPEVIVHALRTRTDGDQRTTRVVEYWLERFPAGWRLTWSTGW